MLCRVLDPILFDLLNPAIRRTATSVSLMGKELEGFSYNCHFDERYINHLLEALLSVVKFGGPSLSRTARTTPIRRSHHLGLTVRLEVCESSCLYFSPPSQAFPSVGIVDTEASYLDVLVDVLLRYVHSGPADYARCYSPPKMFTVGAPAYFGTVNGANKCQDTIHIS